MNSKEQLLAAAQRAGGYTSDSRAFEKGDIFVALKGEKTDGHDYVASVLARGPSAVVVQKGWGNPSALPTDLIFEADDAHAVHRLLAGAFRDKFKGKVIAVGGSSGKTSTKEFLAQILSTRFKLVKTDRSQNGELGIPKTLEKLRDGVEVAVIEVGIDAPGDMGRHAQLVRPDFALLTSIGEEHLNLLKTVENVFREEKILFDVTLARKGICFAPGADPWLRKLEGTAGVILSPADATLYSLKAAARLRERLPNAYAIQNATLALAVARQLGLSEADVLRGIESLSLPDGRGNVLRPRERLTVIADHYNSNPSSLKAGLQSASEQARRAKLPLKLFLGDMLDLGDQTEPLHASVVKEIISSAPQELWLIGPEMSRLKPKFENKIAMLRNFNNSAEAAEFLKAQKKMEGVILIKGSRGMKLEHLLSAFT